MSTELNWMQEYAASEMVELHDDGRLSRREMIVRLVTICRSAGAASAFLAACGGEGSSGTAANPPASPASSAAAEPDAAPAAKPATAPTAGGAGHLLSVRADDPDINGENVTFPRPASTMLGYFAQPAAGGTRPGVIVIHEIFGLNDHIRDVARRLAKVGYLALAVDLASRAGGTEKAANVSGVLTQGSVDDRVADLDAGVAYLDSKPDYDGKLGVVGFCFGGGMTLSFAAANPKVLAAVPYYGPTPQPPSVMSNTKAAIMANYGADDTRVNAGIDALEAALVGKTFQKYLYEGAGHAFNNDTGPSYNEAAAVTAWNRTIDWFGQYLK
ncbi:MAG: dienelactone hydrolase family protein [Actinobacteria bacterium]|nr:dienelactone hydrolase family protein [Actinomycetota bacterium]